jgi:hypothetical protein
MHFQDCTSSCSPFLSTCQSRLPGSSIFGMPAAVGVTDVTCAGGGSSAFPYSVNLWSFTTAPPLPPSSPCVPQSSASILLSPAPVGSSPFSLGPCRALAIGGVSYGVQLLGVSFSKNFIALIYNDPSCGSNSYITSVSGQARGDCPAGQVAPSSVPTVLSQSSVYFAAQVPAQSSSTTIACTCKCASLTFISGPILGCTDIAASQCGGSYCASRYPGQCMAPNYYLATPPQDPVASQGIPCAGVNGYLLSAKTYRYPAPCPNPPSSSQAMSLCCLPSATCSSLHTCS